MVGVVEMVVEGGCEKDEDGDDVDDEYVYKLI